MLVSHAPTLAWMIQAHCIGIREHIRESKYGLENQAGSEKEGKIRDTMLSYLCDHPATSFVPLPVGCPFLPLLQNSLSACAVFQSKLPEGLAESSDLHIPH